MSTFMLALRNLLRNRRRSLATLLALAIGAAALLLFGGYITDIRYAMLTGYVRSAGHLQVQHRDFFLYGSGNPTAYAIKNYEAIVKAIDETPELSRLVNVVSPTLHFGGIAGNYDAGVSRTVVGSGFVAPDVQRMRRWNEFEGTQRSPPFVLDGAGADAAIVGVGLARVLLLCEPLGIKNCPQPESRSPSNTAAALPADVAALAADLPSADGVGSGSATTGKARIELLAGHGRGSPNVAALSVLAAEDQGMKELDEITVVLQLRQAQQLVFGRAAARATAIMVQLHHTADMVAATRQLQALLDRVAPDELLTVVDFETLNPFYTQTVQLFNTIFGFIFALIGGIVLFTVTNTMNAAVVERTTEIGTLRAVGLRRRGIQALFVTEGLLLGAAGAVIGVSTALLVAFVVDQLHLTWLPPGSSERLPLNVRVWGETLMLLGTAFGLVAIAVASAWWPAYRASRLKIVDALRHI